MKFLSEFRDPASVRKLADRIKEECGGRKLNLMEVCGTHTVSIFRSGLKALLPKNLRLLSGPGCPVCVTPRKTIDKVIAYARQSDTIIATFGDMLNVPGSSSSLREEKARKADIRLIYSPLECLTFARERPDKRVILLAIGFETTTPAVAATVLEAKRLNLPNLFFLSGGKLIPPAMAALLEDGENRIDGFLCPGHVSVIIGKKPYAKIAKRYGTPCVIGGFEPLDILLAIRELVLLTGEGKAGVENLYPRAVREDGNPKARRVVEMVFEVRNSEWRGLGTIPQSGFFLRPEYDDFNIEAVRPVTVVSTEENPACLCGEMLRGVSEPEDCPSFGSACTPSRPLGPCMVSSEGACSAWYKYRPAGGSR